MKLPNPFCDWQTCYKANRDTRELTMDISSSRDEDNTATEEKPMHT